MEAAMVPPPRYKQPPQRQHSGDTHAHTAPRGSGNSTPAVPTCGSGVPPHHHNAVQASVRSGSVRTATTQRERVTPTPQAKQGTHLRRTRHACSCECRRRHAQNTRCIDARRPTLTAHRFRLRRATRYATTDTRALHARSQRDRARNVAASSAWLPRIMRSARGS
jgi:hypothetical protein